MSASSNGGPVVSREKYRQIEDWRQQALAQRNQYQSRVQDQVDRQFYEYSPPFYASLIGYKRDWNLLVTTSRISGFAATLGRDLEDEETKVIAEYTLSNIHTNAALKWFTLGIAAYMTYRGRRTWQFPFYKPKMNGRFNPNEATSIFSNKKIRGPYPRFIWHTMRFTAYAAVTMLLVEPVFRAVSFIRTESAMAQDSRLQQFTKDASKRVEQVMANPNAAMTPFKGNETEKNTGDDVWQSNPALWTKTPPVSPPQSQASDQDWDVLDDEDDASPVSSSSRSKPISSTAGSAWDRIRQQSRGGQQPGFESRGWESQSRSESQPQSQSQSQSSWGNSSDSSSDSFSFSRTDEEKILAKEQAQQEFDQLVERERKGTEQERSWGR